MRSTPLGIGGYNFIFDVRDNLFGFVDGRVIRTKTGETMARCIEEYYLRYPFVSRFVMDRGSEFTYAEVKTLLKRYGVIAEYTTAAHRQVNAPVERGHSTITNLLAKWTDGRPHQWPNFLRIAGKRPNITVRRRTDYAPTTLWYGRHATFPIESFLKTWRRQNLETDLTFEELLDLRARQIDAIEDRIEEAASRTAYSRAKDKFRWDKMARVRKEPLKVGDIVLLYDSSLEKQWSRKLDKRWLGPYRVTRCGKHEAYQIEELNETAWKNWVSGSRMKKFVAHDQVIMGRSSLTPLGAAMPRGRGGAEPVEPPLGATRQRAQMGTRREDRPPVFQGGNIELFLIEFERHAREFGWDGTRMLREVLGTGEWTDPIANLVRESLTWQDFERKMEGLHPSLVGRDGQPIRFDSTNLGEFLWAYDQYADELDIPGEQRTGSFLLYVRRHIRSFVRSIVTPAMSWGHCKKLLWNYYTPTRQAGERGSLEKRRREPEAEERRTFERGMSSGTQREDRRKEPRSHRHERAGRSGGPGVPPQPARREVECPMPDVEPGEPHEPQVQEQKEEQSAQEKELDRKEREARDQEIKVQLRMRNLAELHERMQQRKVPEEVDDRRGKGTCTQEEDLPLFSEVWIGFDRLMEVAGRSGGHHQEMGVKLVSTDLFNLRGVMREGFAAARASDQKVGERLTKVAQKIRERPVAEAFRCQKEEEKADQQEGEEIPLIDKEMLEPRGELAVKSSQVGGFEWRMPAGLTLGQESAMPEERPSAEAVRVEAVLPTAQGETMGQQEGQKSVGQTMVETEPRVGLKKRQGSVIPQDMPLVAGLRDALGSWATGSGPEGRVGEQVMPIDERAACPTSPEVPQQEVTSKISAVLSSVPSQEGDKTSQKKVGKCFYCKKGKHRSDDCPKSLKDKAMGLLSESPLECGGTRMES
ncbi:hypothetical protein CBR_g32533 [Chara braunii]|uniref:Integrase catalytic domain-containing protein n=1 Tax=Chara braunii TaxID=69332 RepID=A0A388LH35_CHABU|nr:hypothetical protein CBR_g32533 [Chara braunii]|eukprot:GBG81543.1 hypothetical protein CBR_g32533 [Chara braunii]